MSSSVASMSASVTASVSASASAHAASQQPPIFKVVGIILAVGSGFLIGSSFVIKKVGLLRATEKAGTQAGEGHAYLKNWIWWSGMMLMVVGEILNFVAYAFAPAILVTPLGALSVVICAILSTIFLKETLTFFGWIGCTLCIMGSIILCLNAPEQPAVTTIKEFQKLFLSPGFLVWAILVIIASAVLIFWAAPKWGKTNMLVYISICSLIGGLSVSCLQGLGACILTSIRGNNQFKHYFLYITLAFVVVTLLLEINYLNKALELFNTSMVSPVYFIMFTTATLITSFILYRGLKASAVTLITMVLGFLVTCLGITLLQMSKVDPNTLKGLDRRSTIFMQATKHQTEDTEKGEITALEEPGMDALRGGFGAVGSIIRSRSARRLSNASTIAGGRRRFDSVSAGLSTHGMQDLQRYQLSDSPMPLPDDAMDKINLYSPRSPSSPTIYTAPGGFPTFGGGMSVPEDTRPRSKSQIKFGEEDIVHQYGYNAHNLHSDEVTHTSRTPRGEGSVGEDDPVRPSLRQEYSQRSNSLVPPSALAASTLKEEEAPELEPVADGERANRPAYTSHYSDPYARSKPPARGLQDSDALSPSTRSGLASLLTFGSVPDLGLGKRKGSRDEAEDKVRSGHRGVKDYPHIKSDVATDQAERKALVSRDKSDDEDEEMGRREPSSATSDSPNVQIRRLPELPPDSGNQL